MRKGLSVGLLLILLLTSTIGGLSAQSNEQTAGAIQGVVHEDVDGDGKCVDTGVAGEGTVADVDVEFVSSDEQTILTMYSSQDGAFGLFAAGFSYWKLTAKPSAEWVVTSENPIYAPIDKENPAITGLFFCVQKAENVTVYLPASGAPVGAGWLAGTAVFGFSLLLAGIVLETRRNR